MGNSNLWLSMKLLIHRQIYILINLLVCAYYFSEIIIDNAREKVRENRARESERKRERKGE